MTKKITSVAAGLCAATAALALSTSVTAEAAEPGRYAAIGDSYACVDDPIQIDAAADRNPHDARVGAIPTRDWLRSRPAWS